MDKGKDWRWLKEHMPRVVAQLAEYREAGEGAPIDECWHRGVVLGQPGWLYAVEGSIAIGTPFGLEHTRAARDAMARRALESSGVLVQVAPLPDGRARPEKLNAQQRSARGIVAGNVSSQLEAEQRAAGAANGA